MKHVRIRLSAQGREADIHPMYDLVTNASCVDRATAIQWNFTGTEFGIMHYVEGDRDRFVERVERIPEVIGYDVAPAGPDSFYAYIRDETTEATRTIFGLFQQKPMVVLPPIEYSRDGAGISLFGPAEDIQLVIEHVPDPMSVDVQEVTGMAAVPGVTEPLLTDRQRVALEAALEVGYYEIPRTGSHEDVAEAIDCAPSTAAEHIRKAEATLIQSLLGG